MTEIEAIAFFCLAGDPRPEVLRTRYRELIQLAHPDQGGDRETFERVVLAWAVIRETEAARELRRLRCFRCGGQRVIMQRVGFGAFVSTCPTCKGAGTCQPPN